MSSGSIKSRGTVVHSHYLGHVIGYCVDGMFVPKGQYRPPVSTVKGRGTKSIKR